MTITGSCENVRSFVTDHYNFVKFVICNIKLIWGEKRMNKHDFIEDNFIP